MHLFLLRTEENQRKGGIWTKQNPQFSSPSKYKTDQLMIKQ